MTKKQGVLLLTLSALLLLAACQGATEQAQIPTATLAPVVSQTPRVTATPVMTRTPLPTATFTPSQTPIPPTPSNTFTPSPTPPIVGIIASMQTVNVREGPGVNFGAIEALVPGTGVTVLGQSSDGSWLNIRLDDGRQGWVARSLVRLQDTPTPIPTPTPSPNLTALFLGTPLPTAILGGGTVTPTPPRSVVTPTPVGTGAAQAVAAEPSVTGVAMLPVIATETPVSPAPPVVAAGGTIPPIDLVPIQQTATALNIQITPTQRPLGGPTGGPIGPTAAPPAGGGSEGSVSSQEGVDILAYCNDPAFGSPPPNNLAAGATIDIYWSWYAKDEALLRQHIENVIYEVTIDGVRLQNWRQYASRVRQQADGNYYIYWFVPFGPLDAGQYTINYRVSWQNKISDGYADFGPGTGTPSQTGSCTFNVR